MQKIETFMRTRVVTVELDDTLRVVSDRDLLRALSPYIGTAAEMSRDLFPLLKERE